MLLPMKSNRQQKSTIHSKEAAFWVKGDNEYPVNKVFVNGKLYAQHRLRYYFTQQISKMKPEQLKELENMLRASFPCRQMFSSCSTWVDDVVVEFGLWKNNKSVFELVDNFIDGKVEFSLAINVSLQSSFVHGLPLSGKV